MTSLAQTLHQYKAEEGVVVAFQTGHSFDWQTGESTPTVELEQSRNGGESFTCRAIIPLSEAIAFAKAILAAQEQAEDDAWIDAQYERHLDRMALEDDALEDGGYGVGYYERSIQ